MIESTLNILIKSHKLCLSVCLSHPSTHWSYSALQFGFFCSLVVHLCSYKDGGLGDAFNINHMQCTGRTRSPVYQWESALASGVGMRVSAPLSRPNLILSSPEHQWVFVSHLHTAAKLGLETFSTTFWWTALQWFWEIDAARCWITLFGFLKKI